MLGKSGITERLSFKHSDVAVQTFMNPVYMLLQEIEIAFVAKIMKKGEI